MISLVTACMNRETHLRAALSKWLKYDRIGEFVLVDWSTRDRFDDLLDLDPRVRVVRALNESRWVLSYAYNLGIEHAQGDIILKCDSDCLPQPGILDCVPGPGRFFAGDWRTGDRVGKTCVNGQCVFTKAQWKQVNGYSELIRRYGYDDTDFYLRLGEAGHTRTEIIPALLDFLQHTDRDRVANHAAPSADRIVDELLHRQLHYHEATNMIIIALLPWGPWFRRAAYESVSHQDRLLEVKRLVEFEIPLSDTLMQVAQTQAIRSVTSRLCQIPLPTVNAMSEATCREHLLRFARLNRNTAAAISAK